MIKKISDICTLFLEDGQVVGMLHQNGSLKIYTVREANKAEVASLMEVERAEDINKE